MESQWPEISEIIFRIAPTSIIVLAIVGLGYYMGRRSRDHEVAILKKWLRSLR